MSDKPWYVYMLECRDGSLYTGATTDPKRREHQHNHTKAGGAYTRSRRPVKLVWSFEVADKSEALKLEHFIKRFGPKAKHLLVAGLMVVEKIGIVWSLSSTWAGNTRKFAIPWTAEPIGGADDSEK